MQSRTIPGPYPGFLRSFRKQKWLQHPKAMLIDLLKTPENAFITVEDGEVLSLGDKTLTFIHTPWVHWPETMVTLAGMIQNLKVEILSPVLCKGSPAESDFKALDDLAAAIANKHKELNLN